MTYQLEEKKIPSNLPRQYLNMDNFPSALVPKEEECKKCKNTLSDPYEITSRAIIIGVTKVSTGNKRRSIVLPMLKLLCRHT